MMGCRGSDCDVKGGGMVGGMLSWARSMMWSKSAKEVSYRVGDQVLVVKQGILTGGKYPEVVPVGRMLDVVNVSGRWIECDSYYGGWIRCVHVIRADWSTIDVLKRMINEQPANSELRSSLAIALYSLGEQQSAINEIDGAIEQFPESSDLYYFRGYVYGLRKDHQKAIADYSEAIRLGPENPFVFCNRSLAWTDLGELGKADDDIEAALSMIPNDPRLLGARGYLFLLQEKYDLALKVFNRLIRKNQKLDDAYCHRGYVWQMKGNVKKAMKDYNQAIRLGAQNSELYFNRGHLLFLQGEFEKAMHEFDLVNDLDDKYPWCFYGRGLIYLFQRDRRAIVEFRRTFEIEGNGNEWRYYAFVMAVIASRLFGDHEAEGELVDQAGLVQGFEWPRAVLDFLLGRLTQEAILRHEKSDYRWAQANAWLGYVELNNGDLKTARSYFETMRDEGDRRDLLYQVAVEELARL